MIPLLGLMIGVYIFTRMFEILVKGSKLGDVIVRILAVLTMITAVFCVLGLLLSGTSVGLPTQ
jgi:hypothetical protein